MSAGSGNLFSREYYGDCLGRLKEGGIMAQWLPLHQLSQEEFSIIVATFSEVFPHTTLWFGLIGSSVPVAGLVGSTAPLSLSIGALEARYAALPIAEAGIALDDPYMLLSHYICTVTPGAYGTRLNTDRRPVLEFLNPRVRTDYATRGASHLEALLHRKESVAPYVRDLDPARQQLLSLYDDEICDFIALHEPPAQARRSRDR